MGVPFAKLNDATIRMEDDLKQVVEIFDAEPRDMPHESRHRLQLLWMAIGDLLIRAEAERD